jgi:hypothetical protein
MNESDEPVSLEPGQEAIIQGQHVTTAKSSNLSCGNDEDMCLFHNGVSGCKLFGTFDDRYDCDGRIFVTPERFLVLRLKGLT